jgi:DDE superfamily endonuclease
VCTSRQLAGKIVVIWDGSPIQRGHQIKAFLKRRAAKGLHLEQVPGYAPDLNPDEGIWNYLEAWWSWATCAVPIWISDPERSFERESVCGTKRRSSRAVLVNAVTRV